MPTESNKPDLKSPSMAPKRKQWWQHPTRHWQFILLPFLFVFYSSLFLYLYFSRKLGHYSNSIVSGKWGGDFVLFLSMGTFILIAGIVNSFQKGSKKPKEKIQKSKIISDK